MTPPIVDSNVVYQSHMRYSNARVTTAATTAATTTTTAGTRGSYTTPTKSGRAAAAASGPSGPISASPTTPATVNDSTLEAYSPDPGNGGGYSYGGTTDGGDYDHDDDDDIDSEFATAEGAGNGGGSRIQEVSGGMLGFDPRAAGGSAVDSTGVRHPGMSPTGYQVPGGRGFAAPAPHHSSINSSPPPESSPAATRASSNATLKSGLPRHAASANGANGSARNKNIISAGPPISTVKTKPKKKSARSKKYERQIAAEAAVAQYYAEDEPFDEPRPVRPERAPTGTAPSAALGATSTNPFDDSFDTAAASNIPVSAAAAAGGRTTPTDSNPAASANVMAPSSPSAIRTVRDRHQKYQQEKQRQQKQQKQQQQKKQQHSSSINRTVSTDTNNSRRAEKSPTPTNAQANLSVPRAPSNASTHVGPLDEMTITSAGTGESWKRAEEEFAAAEAAARSERARWGGQLDQGSGDDDDEDGEGDALASPTPSVSFEGGGKKHAGGGSAKRPSGILKTSSARAKGRPHPWDKKDSGASDRGDGGDNDTLFDFEDEASKKQRAGLKASSERRKAERRASASRGIKKSMSHDSAMSAGSRGRRHAVRRGKSYDDDESHSTAPGLTLQDRTQEAWKRKKGGSGTNEVTRSRSAPRAGRSGSAVAFTKDTIHHFENDDQSTIVTKDDSLVSAKHRRGRRGDEAYSDDDTYYSRRTTATDYSTVPKSYESEVEDLVKDFFFIGRGGKSAPGAKRHHSHYKKYSNDDNDDSTFDGTFATNDESTYVTRDESTYVTRDESTYVTRDESTYVTRDSVDEETLESLDMPKAGRDSKSKRRSGGNDEDDQTLLSVDHVKKSNPCGQENCEDNPLSVVWEFMEGGLDAMTQALGLSEAKPESKSTSTMDVSSKGKTREAGSRSAEDNQATLSGLMDYATDVVYGQNSSDMGSRTVSQSPTQSMDTSVDKEAGLVELSLCAAKAKHMTSGVTFDENAEIDVVNDIKFNVITTSLPLGLLFQENSAGCWVAKVFASGNAANATIAKSVEIGDQLAAVNGNSTIKLTVDEVCDMISSSQNSDEIELTFLRYVGPLHSQEKTAPMRSASPLRRSKGSGLFRGVRSSTGRGATAAAPAATDADASAQPQQKQKKGFSLVRSRSKQKKVDEPAPAPAPVPAVSASTSSDFLGDNDGTGMPAASASQAAGKEKKKKKLSFFGRKKKGNA